MNGNPVVVSQSLEEEVDRSLWKILLLVLLAAFLNVGAIHYFNQFLLTGQFGYFLVSAVLGGFFLAFIVLDTMLIKDWKKLQFAMILFVVAPLILYYEKLYPVPSQILLIGSVIFLVLLSSASRRGFNLQSALLKVKFSSIAKVILPKAAAGLFIFLTILLYLQYFEWGKFDEKVGKNFLFQSLSAAEPIVKIFYTNFSFNYPISKVLNAIAEAQLKKSRPDFLSSITSDLSLDFSKLPEKTQKKLIEQAVGEIKKFLVSLLGDLNDQMTVKDYIFDFLKNRVQGFLGQAKFAFGFIVAAIFFSLLKSIEVSLRWLIVFAGFLIYKFLLAINFAHIGLETRSREFVVLS